MGTQVESSEPKTGSNISFHGPFQLNLTDGGSYLMYSFGQMRCQRGGEQGGQAPGGEGRGGGAGAGGQGQAARDRAGPHLGEAGPHHPPAGGEGEEPHGL